VDQLGEQDVDRENGHNGMVVGGGEDIHETPLNQEVILRLIIASQPIVKFISGCEPSWSWVDDNEDIESDYDDDMMFESQAELVTFDGPGCGQAVHTSYTMLLAHAN
jgi:hypothetical protein